MRWIVSVLLWLPWATVAVAQGNLDELFEGFEAEGDIAIDETRPEAQRSVELTGNLNLGASLNYAQTEPAPGQPDYRGLSRLRGELSLQLDLELPLSWTARVAARGFRDGSYTLRDRGDFSQRILDTYETELEFQELYLLGELRHDLDLKFGRQVMNWGRSDNIRIVDVLNPLDNREPGLTDIEDIRLPVTMTRLDWYRGQWSVTGIAIHESRFDVQPPPGTDFYPPDIPDVGEERPANGGSDTEWAAAVSGIFSGWSIAFHWARFFDRAAHIELRGTPPMPLMRHSRLTMWGATGDLALGNWLVKTEAARFCGIRTFARRGHQLARSDALVGIEYSGFDETTLSMDIALRHLHGFRSPMENPPDFARRNAVQTALRYTGHFWNDTLHITALASIFGERAEDGSAFRLSIDYDLTDAVTVGCGVLIFEDGDLPPFTVADHNDRVFASARWSF